jgi:phosphomannomutase
VYFGDEGWALVRASNTSPKLSLRFEGRTPEIVEQMKAAMRAELAKHLEGIGDL